MKIILKREKRKDLADFGNEANNTRSIHSDRKLNLQFEIMESNFM